MTINLLFLLPIVLRFCLFLLWPHPLDADECAEALMAMDLLRNHRFLVGWMGQDYMGSAEIYYLALFCNGVGWSPTAIRLSMLLLAAAQMFLVLKILERISTPRAAILAMGLLLAVSPFALDWELRARSYQMMILFVLGALYLASVITKNPPRNARVDLGVWLLIGINLGIAIWTNELALIFLPSLLLFAATKSTFYKWKYVVFGIGGIVGYSPRLVYDLRSGFSGFKFLGGALAQVNRQEFEKLGWEALLNNTPFLSMPEGRIDALVTGLGIPLLSLLLLGAVLSVILYARHSKTVELEWRILLGLVLAMALALAVASKPRYAVLAIPCLLLFVSVVFHDSLAFRLTSSSILYSFTALLILFSFFSTYGTFQHRPDIPEMQLTKFVLHKGFRRGISGYHLAHKMMFYSGEDLYVSSLGGPEFTTRLLSVERKVARAGAEFVAYEMEGNKLRVDSLKAHLLRFSINYSHDPVAGKFVVYHSFSRPVYPGEYLPEQDMPHYRRHTPDNSLKVMQERANTLF